MFSLRPLLCFVLHPAAVRGENSNCPCLTEVLASTVSDYTGTLSNGDKCLFRDPELNTGRVSPPDPRGFCWPETFGIGCEAHDEVLPPDCVDMNGAAQLTSPQWCGQAWCYVDPAACDDRYVEAPMPSINFRGSGLHYSYETCGGAATFARWSQARNASAPELKEIVQNYAKEIRSSIEDTFALANSGESAGNDCPGIAHGCSCSSCTQNDAWTDQTTPRTVQSLDFESSTLIVGNDRYNGNSAEMRQDKCVSNLIARDMRNIARREYNDENRIAYIYYGSQGTGAMVQWPAMQWCADYDARFRPWYSTASAGPKDVVLVLDKSGSMMQAGRFPLVQAGAKNALLTLGSEDFATVVVFSSTADVYDGTPALHRMDLATRLRMNTFIESQGPMGGTNFRSGLDMAASAFRAGSAAGRTSGCVQAILFLTDGLDETGFQASAVRSMSLEGVVFFTYSFGTNIGDQQTMKKIACQNGGVWNSVPDYGDIENLMARYYQLFSAGIDSSGEARWIEYEDIVTGTQLMAACYSVYDRRTGTPFLYGVVCVDLNVIVSIDEFRNKPGYTDTWAAMRRAAEACPSFHLPPDDLAALRARQSAQSACRPCDMTDENCPVTVGIATASGASPRLQQISGLRPVTVALGFVAAQIFLSQMFAAV